MEEKIKEAKRLIAYAKANYAKPAFMCSFGKDSMVLLHLMEPWKYEALPIIFYRDPWFPKKYTFADQQILKHELEVYDYPPLAMSLWEGESIMSFVSHYQIGDKAGAILQLPKNIIEPESYVSNIAPPKYLCGLNEVLKRPTGSFSYPWDCVLIGHKSSDEDQIAGKVTLHCDIKQGGGIGPDAVFPLRNWTDKDIWDYTDQYKVPQQPDRYDVDNRCEYKDKEANSDYASVCIACCDQSKPVRSVLCPKTGYEVSSALHAVPYTTPTLSYYGK